MPARGHRDVTSRLGLIALALLLACWPGAAFAQQPGSIPPPPVRSVIDENGVDVSRGSFVTGQAAVSIGPAYPHGLAWGTRNFNSGWQSSMRSSLFQSGSTYTAEVEGDSDSFTLSGGVFTPTEAMGATLTQSGLFYDYTSRNGVVVRFMRNSGSTPFWDAPFARPVTITYPDGTIVTYTVKNVSYCPGGVESGMCPAGWRVAQRLQSITNNHGYQLKISYASNTLNDLFPSSTYEEWSRITSVRAINNAVDYCDPAADTCSFSTTWPEATFGLAAISGGVEYTVTTPVGETTRYTSNNGYQVTAIRRPGASSDNVTVSYSGLEVLSVTRDGVTHSYSVSNAGGNRTTTVTDPNSNTRVYVVNPTSYRLTSYTDELSRTTGYTYDGSGRVERITAPEGNYVQYTYDARGNVTQTQFVAKSGSGDATITTTASFPSTCSNPITCNRPDSTTDAMSRTTDYTWDSTHGGVLTVTPPDPGGGTRPQTRYSYTAHQAYYKNSSGSIVASGTNVYLLTGISSCSTGASPSCVGTANESRTVIDWGPQSSGTANNLLPVSSTARDGTGALAATTAATYDNIGNLLTVNGPLAGSDDVVTLRYDANRRRVGTISPDPDGGGSLLRRAQRITYANTGLVSAVDVGTVNGTTNSDWTNFAVLQTVNMTYDSNYRLIRQALVASSATHAVRDLSYDALGRSDCVATRMNPSAWGTLTAACTLQTTGSDGPDRIGRTIYDAAGQATQLQTAVGTADAATIRTNSWTDNGRLNTVTDGMNNLTDYSYDGHDRLVRTDFPSTTQGSGTANTSDYETLAYDANGNITSRRLRDGNSIGFTFDPLNRLTLKNLPGSELDVTYAYDLLNRLTSAQTSAQTLSFTFDALGRNLTQVGPQGTASYQYDLAGRRTRLTYPGSGLYLDYDYLLTGEATHIRENGAGSGIGVLATYAYDNLGRRVTLTRGNGTVTTWGYAGGVDMYLLGQNFAGTADDVIWTFTHNPARQIVGLVRDNDGYAYSQRVNLNVTDAINGLNQITATGVTSLTHDARGNTTAIGAVAYGYTSENMMVTAPSSATLAYDPLVRLYETVGGGTTTRFAYDGVTMIAEYNGSNSLQRRFVHGSGVDEPIVWYEGTGTSDRRFLHADERGSIVAVSDGSGNVTNVNSYDEYGTPASTNVGRFGYTGQAWIAEAGLWYYRARMYNPSLGRFMQTDPIGYDGGMNLYAYVNDDPVNLTDPMGLDEGAITITGQRSCDGIVIGGFCESEFFIENRLGGARAFDGGAGDGGGGGGQPITVTAQRPQPRRRREPPLDCGAAPREGGAYNCTSPTGNSTNVLPPPPISPEELRRRRCEQNRVTSSYLGDPSIVLALLGASRYAPLVGNAGAVLGYFQALLSIDARLNRC